MKNILLKLSLKFGLILGGINLMFGLIDTLTFNHDNLSQPSFITFSILMWIILILFLALAHYEFNKNNKHFISFKEAILIGLIVIGIGFFITTVYSYVNYEFILKEKMQIYNSNINEEFGLDVNELISPGNIVLSSLGGLLIQILLLFSIITIESIWKIYKKAGKKGWALFVPFYGTIVLLEIVKKPIWWLILLLTPFVNLIYAIWIINLLSKRFGKDEGFTVGLLFLPFIFYPLLGMSKAEYIDE